MVMRSTKRPIYPGLPGLPAPTWITNWRISVVVPVARTNLISNPSFESATTGWAATGAGSIARVTTQSYHGAYGLEVTPDSGASGHGVFFSTFASTANTTYGVSIKFKGTAGLRYRFEVQSTAAVVLRSQLFTATGSWQWLTMLYTDASTASRRIYVVTNAPSAALFYIDGAQVEALAAGAYACSTYIDGDQSGFLGARELPPYTWNGAPQASTSNRSGQTRSGGMVIPLTKFGLLLTAIVGLGMAPVDLRQQPFDILDGANWQDERKDEKTLALTMRWGAITPERREQNYADLSALLDRDYIAARQPLMLTAEPLDESGKPIQAPMYIPYVTYTGGLEGLLDNLPVGETTITFTQNLPLITTRQAGAALDVQDTATAGYIMYRDASGQWSVPDTGVTTGSLQDQGVHDIAIDGNNNVYIAGEFTDAGSSGADNGAVLSNLTRTWGVLASATALNAVAWKVRIDAQNRAHYVGGFTNAGGVAAADTYAYYSSGAWATFGTPATTTRRALALDPNTGYPIMDNNSAVALLQWWDGAAYQTSAGSTGAGVRDILFLPGGLSMVIVGPFTDAGAIAAADRVASFDYTTFAALGGAANLTISAVTRAPNGLVYVSGAQTTINGISTGTVAVWNGVQWAAVGTVTGNVREITASPRNEIWIGGSSALVVNGRSPLYLARWNGSTFVPVGLIISNGAIEAITFDALGGVYVGWVSASNGAATSVTYPGRVTVTNEGTDYAYPTITITGPSSGTSRIWQIENQTTQKGLYFDLTMQVGEIVTITTDPVFGLSAYSNVQGNISGKILPGSNSADFLLQTGANVIAMLADSATVTATMTWWNRYNTLPGAIQ